MTQPEGHDLHDGMFVGVALRPAAPLLSEALFCDRHC